MYCHLFYGSQYRYLQVQTTDEVNSEVYETAIPTSLSSSSCSMCSPHQEHTIQYMSMSTYTHILRCKMLQISYTMLYIQLDYIYITNEVQVPRNKTKVTCRYKLLHRNSTRNPNFCNFDHCSVLWAYPYFEMWWSLRPICWILSRQCTRHMSERPL